MADDEHYPAQAPLTGAGPRLKVAREAAGLSVAQISAQTKIPGRMLALIEAGDFGALPGRTYATGFTRTYARMLGLDEAEYVAAVRNELGLSQPAEQRHVPAFEPGDPARVPTAKFAWLAAVAALLVVAAGLFFWRTYYAPAVNLPSILPPEPATSVPPPPALPNREPLPVIAPTAAADAAGAGSALATARLAAMPVNPRPPAARPPVRRARPAPVPSSLMPPELLEAPAAASTAQN